MFRATRLNGRTLAKRFASSDAKFSNKYNFNITPPPVHEYWNYRNASVLIAFIPLYFAVGYLGKYIGTNIGGYDGLIQFADSEASPMKEIQFGQPQTKDSK